MIKNLKKYNKIFFIGIGGISMSALALLLKSECKVIFGSDIIKNNITRKLTENNIKVFYKQKGKNVRNCDLIVYSGAIKEDNEEIKEAKKRKIPFIERSELLGAIAREYKNVIAISGTHGKTTTTAMIGYIFTICGLNPTVHLGGNLHYFNGNIRFGCKNYFITEACEFRDSFLKLKPDISVITNIEREHLDYFKSFNKEIKSFNTFIKNTKRICFINKNYKKYIDKKNLIKHGKLKTFGTFNSCDLFAKNITKNDKGQYIFDCYKKPNIFIDTFILNIFGKYNLENALCAISVCLQCGIDYKSIYLGLKTFENVERRCERIGTYKNVPIITDYAHHPTEIKNIIESIKENFNKKIVCVFQPHTFSRTKLLIDDFRECFNDVNKLILLKTYSAREKFDYDGSCEQLKNVLQESNPKKLIYGVYSKRKFLKYIKKENFEDSILLFLGAGDINLIAEKLAKKN